jgi:hypothetical protein
MLCCGFSIQLSILDVNVILVSVNFLSSFLPWWRKSKREITLLAQCQCVFISAVEPVGQFS